MGYWKNQAVKFGILAGMMQLGKAMDEQAQQEQEQQDVYEAPPQVQEVQPRQPVQEMDTGRRRGTMLDAMIRNGTLR